VRANFQKALTRAGIPHKLLAYPGARPGFMCPAEKTYERDAAEAAYFEVYEFLGKYVEDAPSNNPAVGPEARPVSAQKAFATIADIMRAVNEPTGVRGALAEALATRPGKRQDWQRVRAGAALLAEAGNLLRVRTPPKGSREHWREQVEAYSTAAEGILQAADRRDYPAARRGLQELSARCAACHRLHR
jgi:hypothetical protein